MEQVKYYIMLISIMMLGSFSQAIFGSEKANIKHALQAMKEADYKKFVANEPKPDWIHAGQSLLQIVKDHGTQLDKIVAYLIMQSETPNKGQKEYGKAWDAAKLAIRSGNYQTVRTFVPAKFSPNYQRSKQSLLQYAQACAGEIQKMIEYLQKQDVGSGVAASSSYYPPFASSSASSSIYAPSRSEQYSSSSSSAPQSSVSQPYTYPPSSSSWSSSSFSSSKNY